MHHGTNESSVHWSCIVDLMGHRVKGWIVKPCIVESENQTFCVDIDPHCSDVTWASGRLRSPVIRFVQTLFNLRTADTAKLRITGSLCGNPSGKVGTTHSGPVVRKAVACQTPACASQDRKNMTSVSVGIHTYMCVVNFDALAQVSDFRIKRR